MKKSILLVASAIISTVLLSACDSANTSATSTFPELGGERIQETYQGTFAFTNSNVGGTVQLDLQRSGTALLGNMIFTSGGNCLCNTAITGSQNGFNILLQSQGGETACQVDFRPGDCAADSREPDGRCPIETAGGAPTYLLSGSDATLNGSFTVSGNICQVFGLSNSGSIQLRRL